MKRLTTLGAVDQNGGITLSRRESFMQRWSEEFKGKKFVLTVEKETRNLRQNALLWVWNTIVADELGWTPEEVHEFDKGRIKLLHRTRIDRKTGEMIDIAIPRTTHDMPLDEFAEMMTIKQRLWAEEGIILPSSYE